MSSRSEQKLLRQGAIVAGKYRVDKAIARGGFSVVYRGTHIEMQRPVGLKILNIDADIRASWLERFTREARLASQLTHPHTVTIYDYGQDANGFLYITMEWVQGVSLHQYLTQSGPLSAPAVARISVQILDSLQEAHQLNFLHRDLKPSNIMLSHDYQGKDSVKVLDFGIAKDLSEKPDSSARITHQGAFVGTPRYASPEQLEQAKELGPPSDIYSLGLLMWEALVGDPAVKSTRYGDCVQMHMSDAPWRLPGAINCAPGLERILYKALAKPVAQRYSGCASMRRELIAWLKSPQAEEDQASDEPFSKRPAKQPPPLPRNAPVLAAAQRNLSKTSSPPKTSAQNSRPESSANDDLASQLDRVEKDHRDNRPRHPARAKGRSTSPAPAPPAEPRDPTPTPTDSRVFMGTAALLGVVLIALIGWWGLTRDDPADAHAPVDTEGSENLGTPARDDGPGASPGSTSNANLLKANAPEANAPTTDYSPALIWAAVQESGWKRLGKIGTLEVAPITQENGRFRKKSLGTVAVTLYRAENIADMPDYSAIAEPPVQIVDFGKTVAQIAPGTPGGSDVGVRTLTRSLMQLKQIGQEQAAEPSPVDPAP